jgi:hypothetical protein
LALAVVIAGWTSSQAAASDTRPPRIVAAAMQDADGDARADRLRLRFSERVRHAADRDGRYPLRVAGYRIRAIGTAKGSTVVLKLAEPASADDAARPVVRYARMRAKAGRVADRAGNQAARQAFRATRAHGNRPGATPLPQPGARPSRAAAGPRPRRRRHARRAGLRARRSRRPPGRTDTPDLSFLDSNCDGIDGDANGAIFVAPLGDSANPGTRSAPKREISQAVVAAGLEGKDVYVAGGDYGRVDTVSGVDIYGGYHPTTWARDAQNTTRILGKSEAVLAKGDTVTLQLLTATTFPDAPGASKYAIRALAGAKLTLQAVTLLPGPGESGSHGVDGADGQPGGDGGNGESGSCDLFKGGSGGSGGGSAAGRRGGQGGDGGRPGFFDGKAGVDGQIGSLAGAGGRNGNPGKKGLPGADGDNGASGIQGDGGADQLAFDTWRGGNGVAGTSGQRGQGGGGGGGGGGQTGPLVFDGLGNGGGGGGGGGWRRHSRVGRARGRWLLRPLPLRRERDALARQQDPDPGRRQRRQRRARRAARPRGRGRPGRAALASTSSARAATAAPAARAASAAAAVAAPAARASA